MTSNSRNDSYTATRRDGMAESNDNTHGLRYDQIASDVQHQIEEKPISSVAIAVGVGVGAGLLLSTLLSSERVQQERLARRVGNYLGGSGNLRSSFENFLPSSLTDRYFN